MVGASEAARRDEKNIFGDILDTIDIEEWFDGMVNQPPKKEKNSSQGSIPTASDLEESTSDFDDRPIGAIIGKVEKKKVAAKMPKQVAQLENKMPSRVVEDEEGEVVKPLRKKFEKRGKYASTSADLEVIIAASTIEQLLAQVAEKGKEVKENIH